MSHGTIELITISHLVVAGLLFIAARRKLAALTYRFQSVLPKPLRAPFSPAFYEKAFPILGILFLAASALYLAGR